MYPQPAPPPQPASPATSTLEQWFDAELRPVLLAHLAAADGQAAAAADTRHRQTLAAFEHWLGSLAQKSDAFTAANLTAREVVNALAGEVRGLLDGVGGF